MDDHGNGRRDLVLFLIGLVGFAAIVAALIFYRAPLE
jgi:hypothetical protein